MIHFYKLSTMDASQRVRLLRRAELQIDELIERVRPIIQAVRERGDEALVEFTARFDHVQLSPDRLRVGPGEIEQAHKVLDPKVRAAIDHAIHNVRPFHEKQIPHELWFPEQNPRVMPGDKLTPISPLR